MRLGLALLLGVGLGAQAPEPKLPKGWTQVRAVVFGAKNLYGHINGGAELFLEFGFEQLSVRYLRSKGLELTLELYRMSSPEAALGIYLGKAGKEERVPGVPVRHSGNPYQITALKGRTLVVLNNPKGRPGDLPAMADLLQGTLAVLPEEQPGDLFALLPTQERVPGSEFLARGPYGLQQVFTFGEGDMLSNQGRHWAVGADYKDASGRTYTRLVVEYGEETKARAALAFLMANLDATLKVKEKTSEVLIFQDFQGLPGKVERKGSTLQIRIRG